MSRAQVDHRARPQSGVVLIIAMIALVVLMSGVAALIRSRDTAQLTASNLAFKRDLVNQGERGFVRAVTSLTSGTLAAEAARQKDLPAANYSATQLASDIHGLPTLLTADDKTFAKAMTLADLGDADADARVTVRYVIDRQCAFPGAYDPTSCTPGPPLTPMDASRSAHQQKPGTESRPVYRISLKVTGPRQTETYLQMTAAY